METEREREQAHLWMTIFTAVLAALLVGGVLLFLGFRAYVYWSVNSAVKQIEKATNK